MTIALILVEIFTVIMQRNVCEKAFDRKPAGTAVQVMVWAAFYIISNVTTYFFELPSWLNMVIFSVSFFGVLTWLYEGSIRIKLVLVLFLCLIGMLSEVMVCFIGILCGIDIIHMMGNTEVAIMYTILSKLVWFVEIKIALLFLKKNKNIIIRNMDWLEVFIVPVSSIFIVMAYVAQASKKTLETDLKEEGMDHLFTEIEMPLVFTLADMENEGIIACREALTEYGDKLAVRIAELEKQIYEEAGEEFNINSPKQLGVILFEKLSMPYGKKTKTGYSTAADVLDRLAPEYPIVSDILEYRQLTKLKSTYADGLVNYIAKDGRIHTSFNQTITATGRLSSTEPNLQNIPMRIELGRLIRKAFVPKEGFEFMDADYSQIELRVLAHMSGDEKLIEAYREAQDIHRITASQVFHIPFDEVTDLQRRNAKAVNFGIVYGISSFGLSQDLSISKKEAAEYIERYFETYPKIKTFLDGLVTEAKEKGYVTTMFGRRRPVPELSSSNFMQRSFGERVAMNSPIQGTAADIIKIAMIRVHDRLLKENLKSRLILTVHDELLVETAIEEEDAVRKILEEEMHGAADLAVTLEIDAHVGKNWYEAK